MIQEPEPNGLVDHQTEVLEQPADLNIPNGHLKPHNFPGSQALVPTPPRTLVVLPGGE